jgi:hypothetical protein
MATLRRLASLTQALIEGDRLDQTAPRGRQGRHVPTRCGTSLLPPEHMHGRLVLCAALMLAYGATPHKGRRFLAIDGPQFGQAAQQVPCGDRADAGHAFEQLPFPAHLVGALRLVVGSCSSARIS